eukprot:1137957-Pelagomonas_calceolata.AAC.1
MTDKTDHRRKVCMAHPKKHGRGAKMWSSTIQPDETADSAGQASCGWVHQNVWIPGKQTASPCSVGINCINMHKLNK